MEKEELVQAVEALLFASGKPVSIKDLAEILNTEKSEITNAAEELKNNLIDRKSGIQVIRVNESYQLATLEKFYSYICQMLDNRPKPSLSQAALEVLSIIAYNQCSTRAEIEKIRGVSSDSALNKLIEYNLVEEAGKMNAPGRPMMYKTSEEFLKMFGYTSLNDLPELPSLKEEDNQISVDELEENDELVNQVIEENKVDENNNVNKEIIENEDENKND